MRYISKHNFLFYLLSFTWGFITSFIGLLLLIPFVLTKRVEKYKNRLYGVFPKIFGSGWGFEMGCFFFTSYDCVDDIQLKLHEMGHGLQNIILGPLMILMVSIPSFIRFWYRKYLMKHHKPIKTAYDDFWVEGWATKWGNKYYGGNNND